MVERSRARSAPGTSVGLTVAGGVLLVAAGFAGTVALAVAVIVLQLAAAASWHDLVRAPGGRPGSIVGFVSGVAATVTLAAGATSGPAGGLAAVAAGGLFLAFTVQLAGSSAGPPRLDALMATSALVLVEVLAGCWLSAADGPDGAWVVAAGVAGAVTAVLLVAAAGTRAWVVLAVLALSATVAAVVGQAGPESMGRGTAAGVGASAGVAALCGAQVRRLAGRSARTAPATVAALPLVVAAPGAFVAARILLG